MTTNYQPQFPGLQPAPPNPGVPGKNHTTVWIATVILTVAAFVGVLIALSISHSTHQTGSIRDQAFLSVVRTDVPAYNHTPDAVLIRAGHTTCNLLNSGGGLLDAVQAAVTSGGLTPLDAGQLVGASIGAYCPNMAP